jgi:hypothetical protein
MLEQELTALAGGDKAMTSRQFITLVSVLVLALVLTTAGDARAQYGYGGWFGYPASPFDYWSFGGAGYGSGYGYGYGPFGSGGYGDIGGFVGFPFPGYATSSGQVPMTMTAFPALSDFVTSLPGWNGRAHRIRRRR